MREYLKALVDLFTSLKLTVVLLVLSMVLVFIATLAQVDLGVWAVQQKYFHSLFVMTLIPGTHIPVPVFPGGYFIGGLLLINLIAAHAYRFRLSWRQSGIWMAHFGLILLLVGQFFTGIYQQESQMRLNDGQTKDFSESYLDTELAVIDTSNPSYNDVVAIPLARLEQKRPIQYPKLPFTIRTQELYYNSNLQMRSQVPGAAPSPANQGFGPQLVLTPEAITYKMDGQNFPSAYVELTGSDGPLGTWLVSTLLDQPQTFTYDNRTWELELRATRYYLPFSVTLLKFTHDDYPGSDIPKNFASLVKVHNAAGTVDRQVRIYMNHPLRFDGRTFYQAGYANNNRTTILQVVKNPSWLVPYISCALIGLGLLIQFSIHLVGFIRKRAASPAAA